MTIYTAPQRDMRFVMDELLKMPEHYASLPGCEDATPDLVSAIREEGAKFSTNIIAPLNQVGDSEGCTWKDGEVTAPTGFKEAYQQFCEAGWPSLIQSPEYGGQGLPLSISTMFSEMTTTANNAWGMVNGASLGALETLAVWGTEEQKNTYMPKMVSGHWTGTMCLTESHCGSDLGLLRTKAEPNADGSYSLTGTKIFITEGEHDMSENIIHIVLARLPDAPAGVKGISLFIVPKFHPKNDGETGERNSVTCGSIEHKMGIHGSPTCVMNFDQAKGYLIGPANRGLQCMFTFMNNARLGVAMQGVAHAELGFQKSLAYAKDRLQMRSLTGPKNPEGPADPIIVHPDVRRLLLTQKSYAEGGRMLNYYIAKLLDIVEKSESDADKLKSEKIVTFLTPIAKAFLTEAGFEAANMGLQCFGGHGYIKEWGVEQNVRDSRITCIYEGTTAIQALDLINRKILMDKSESMGIFIEEIQAFCQENINSSACSEFIAELETHVSEWQTLVETTKTAAVSNPDELGAVSVDFLMYSGYLVLGYFWAQAAVLAESQIEAGTDEKDFYQAKIKTANFYFKRLLPRTRGHVATMHTGAEALMNLDAEHFVF